MTTPSISLDQQPIIYTGFGHSETRPLPLDQVTTTTCTTDPQVECVLTFINADSEETVEFAAASTGNSGVAQWTWQGSDVGSGTWNVSAKVGNNTSNTEVLFIDE